MTIWPSWPIITAAAQTSARRCTTWGGPETRHWSAPPTWKPKPCCSRGLELLKELPDDMERAREEFDLQNALGFRYSHTTGPGAPEREAVAVRAKELCERLGDEARLIKALMHLANLRMNRLELQPARELAEQALALTAHVDDPGLVAGAHFQLGEVLFMMGALATSREHLETDT